MVYATYSEGFRVGGSNPLKPASILPRIYSSDTLENYEIGGRRNGWTTACGSTSRVYHGLGTSRSRSRTRNGQDGDPPVFQLGYVNLPSAQIQGVESELSFAVNDAWQVDATLGWNDAEVSEATVLTLERDDGADIRATGREGRAAAADARLDGLARHRIAAARPAPERAAICARRRRLRRRIRHKPRGHRVGGRRPAASGTQDAYETGDLRFGLEGENWSGSLFVDNVWDERAKLFLSNRWGSRIAGPRAASG